MKSLFDPRVGLLSAGYTTAPQEQTNPFQSYWVPQNLSDYQNYNSLMGYTQYLPEQFQPAQGFQSNSILTDLTKMLGNYPGLLGGY